MDDEQRVIRFRRDALIPAAAGPVKKGYQEGSTSGVAVAAKAGPACLPRCYP
jgi:hypothetical protein